MAERLFSMTAGAVLAVGLTFQESLWWLPWFIGIMLTFAGVTNLCLMVSLLNKLGIK